MINSKSNFLLLFFLIVFQFSIGQTSKINSEKFLSEEDFIKAKEGYLKISRSETYLAMRKTTLSFVNKLGDPDQLDFLLTKDAFEKWINENLTKTKFKSIEEAIDLWKLSCDLNEKMVNENPEVFKLITLASAEQLNEILAPDRLSIFEIPH